MRKPSKAPDDGKVGIVVATYGDQAWREKGIECVEESEQDDDNTKIGLFHWYDQAWSLGSVRNTAARMLRWNHEWDYDWLIFLDADDRLPPDYVTKMREGTGDIRQPMTQGFYPDGSMDAEPHHIPRVRLLRRNFIVIGAMANAEMFWAAGGFGHYPCLEDWDLWLKMYCYVGADIGRSDAIYRVGVNTDGRNQSVEHPEWFSRIRNKHMRAFQQRGWPRD
jgi:hypothetical protein